MFKQANHNINCEKLTLGNTLLTPNQDIDIVSSASSVKILINGVEPVGTHDDPSADIVCDNLNATGKVELCGGAGTPVVGLGGSDHIPNKIEVFGAGTDGGGEIFIGGTGLNAQGLGVKPYRAHLLVGSNISSSVEGSGIITAHPVKSAVPGTNDLMTYWQPGPAPNQASCNLIAVTAPAHEHTLKFTTDTTGTPGYSMIEVDSTGKAFKRDDFHSGNLARLNHNHTFSGDMEHIGDNTFGRADPSDGGVGKSIHWGQVYFHDSSTSGDAAVPSETLCRTADNKLKHYNPDNTSHAWTGTNSYPSLTVSSMLELNGSGNVVSTSGFSSGNLARINADHTISGDWTHSGTVTMSALTASTGLALDSNKNIISGSSGVALGDTNVWTAENTFTDETAFSDTSTYTADLIMETGNMDMEQGDIDVQVGTLMASSGLVNIAAVTAPASASASGTAGQLAFDANYMYRCTATNTWKRVAIASW